MAKGWRWATGRLQKAQEDRDAAYIITKRLQRAESGTWEAAVPERHFFSDTLPLLSLGSADIYIYNYIYIYHIFPHDMPTKIHKRPLRYLASLQIKDLGDLPFSKIVIFQFATLNAQ